MHKKTTRCKSRNCYFYFRYPSSYPHSYSCSCSCDCDCCCYALLLLVRRFVSCFIWIIATCRRYAFACFCPFVSSYIRSLPCGSESKISLMSHGINNRIQDQISEVSKTISYQKHNSPQPAPSPRKPAPSHRIASPS